MAKTNLGKVVGDSAFEDWLKRNPGGTWEEFMKDITGPQGEVLYGMSIQEIKFHTKTPYGDMVYNVIRDDGLIIGQVIAPKGDRGDQGKPGVNWDGTIPEYPDIPTNIPYGTLFELAPGALPIAGWVYANGDTLPKGRYPHLVGVAGFDSRQVPETSDINIDDTAYLSTRIFEDGVEYWSGKSKDSKVLLLKEFRSANENSNSINGRSVYSNYRDSWSSSNYTRYGSMATLDYGTDKEHRDFMEVRFDNEYFLHRFSFYKETSKTTIDKIFIQFKSGDVWTTAIELNPSTDFIPDTDRGVNGEYFYIDLKKYTIFANSFRVVGYRTTSSSMDFCGFRLYAGSQPLEYKEIITLPVAKTTDGRFKIVYVGEPVAESIESMYSYNSRMALNGEVPLELAINNKLPLYSNGITMSEPQETKLGYENVYNKELDSWELVKTHRDVEGYYYDDLGALKYTPKPNNYSVWDSVNHIWNENQELKEQEKQRLTNKLIALEIKKDKMIDLNLETNSIMEKIKLINKKIGNINR